jgi:hypothetical protein
MARLDVTGSITVNGHTVTGPCSVEVHNGRIIITRADGTTETRETAPPSAEQVARAAFYEARSRLYDIRTSLSDLRTKVSDDRTRIYGARAHGGDYEYREAIEGLLRIVASRLAVLEGYLSEVAACIHELSALHTADAAIEERAESILDRALSWFDTLAPIHIPPLATPRKTAAPGGRVRRGEAMPAPSLAVVRELRGCTRFLLHVYTHFPPKNVAHALEQPVTDDVLRLRVRTALVHYHPDKNMEYGEEWRLQCEEITKILTADYRLLD